MPSALGSVPLFLQKAAGFSSTDPVVATFYGGRGSHHLRWRSQEQGGGALPVLWNEDISEEVAERLPIELREGRQLGFIAAHGGSKKEQITHINSLRAEIDLPESKELQHQVYTAVEKRYGIQFTLLDTGGKSLHAWIPLAKQIPVDRYRATSELWYCRIEETVRSAGIDLPDGALDPACHRPTQVMRLPGSIHLKSGRVAKVIQWGTGPVDLDRLGLDWESVEDWAKKNTTRKWVIQTAIEHTCQRGEFLGLTGDQRFDELVSLARSVPVRVPGAGTYQTVLPLVASLSRALGAEQATTVLHYAGHLDKQGNASIQGLREWCETFEPNPHGAHIYLAWLAAWAEREHNWKRPVLSVLGVLEPTQYVGPTPDAISDALFNRGGGLVVCRTGTGKSLGAIAYVDRLDERWVSAAHEFSVVVITPRRTINSQIAARLGAVNVSGQLTGAGDPYRQPGTKQNRYVCCLPSLGKPGKRNGDAVIWGEYWNLGDTGTPPILTGRGAMVTVLLLDEVRQVVTDLLLSPTGPGTLWESPADRWRAGISLVRTILHAGVVVAMDAQAGEPEQVLLRGIGRIEATRVLGCPLERPLRTMRWTSAETRWRDCLLGHAKARAADDKPLLVITGAKGQEGKGGRGVSARALRDALQEAVPAIRVLIIDAESKDTPAARRVLLGNAENWDVVICTPVAQSGVSWIGVFGETVFVAGGRTLPPNICGGQAGRRERTATTCVAHIPNSVWDRSLPLLGREVDEIRSELRHAREQVPDLALAYEREVKILEEVYVLAARRQIQELALFRDYALHYASVDGWRTEELAEVGIAPRQKLKNAKREKSSEPAAYADLDPWRELLVRSLRLQAAGAQREVVEATYTAFRENTQAKKGSAGADLVSANLVEVQEILLKAGLGMLCDGQFRAGNDPLLKQVASALQSLHARQVFRHATWLQFEPSGSTAYPAQTVGAVIARLGGVSKTRKVGARGQQQRVYCWILPGQ